MSQFQSEIGAAETYEEMELIIQRVLGRSGFMHFARFDLGAILRKEGKQLTPKILRILIGNPLVMKEVTSPSHKCEGFSNHACDTFRYVTV
jgi:uncharacterized protein (DUF302 family)